jgi:putative FmdB family regulatory protein
VGSSAPLVDCLSVPTYEYACKSCGEHLEVVQSFRDDPLTECPNCGGVLRKVFGSIGIAFKGSGFYSTDSRDSSGSPKPRSESKEKPAASSGESSSGSTGGSSGSAGGSSGSAGDKGGSSAGKGDSKAAASS